MLGFTSVRSSSYLKQIRFCDSDAGIVQYFVDSFSELTANMGNQKAEEMDVGVAYQWSWTENSGSWKPFDPNENLQIEMGMTTSACVE